ncbi:MAG: hypothetical protein ACI9KE_003303 [Polyangiales bacterium]|jgi:hypothetical protein
MAAPLIPWNLGAVPRPWGEHPSLYSYLASTARGEVAELRLADDDASKLHFAPGAVDSLSLAHGDTAALWPRQLAQALVALHDDATPNHFEHLYRLATRDGTAQVASAFLDEVYARRTTLDPDRLASIARVFAREAPQRDAVKLGIVLFALFNDERSEDSELLQTLGRHEEFTRFVGGAMEGRGAGERALFELAQEVHGWGRIDLVERLASTEDPEIRRWMLRHGHENNINHGYSALTCAETGGLLAALKTFQVELDVLRAAQKILSSLLDGLPFPGFEAYKDGEDALRLFVRHACRLSPNLTFYSTVMEARAHLAEAASVYKPLIAQCDRYLHHDAWPALVRDALADPESAVFDDAEDMAKTFGIDSFDAHFARAKQDPYRSLTWFQLTQVSDDARIDVVLAHAASVLPLSRLCTGAANSTGAGPDYPLYSVLGFVLQGLGRFPGRGEPFVIAGLRSPVVRNRHMAIRAVSAWGRERWSDALRGALQDAAEVEPTDEVHESLQRCLRGEPWDPG